ncbi:MAG: glycosyltransferase family 2 protein [Pyrinomonadaceae bacterium]|nr:glycosyltransferase family 2 protein [Pyrinomonadaceae bacterium]
MVNTRQAGSISVFFPAYNDASTIARMVGDALALLPQVSDDYEVIVVNDGSTDETFAVLETLTRSSPHVKVINHERNQGYGGALRSGFLKATKDLIFYTDGDGQYDARELKHLLPLLARNVDIVNGYKLKRSDARHRRMLGATYNKLARFMFRLQVRDVDCDFRLIRRQALRNINLEASSGVICVELVRKLHDAGCAFAECPVRHYPREHGKSQFFTARRVSRTALDFLLLWVQLVALRRSSSAPQRNVRMISSEQSVANDDVRIVSE